MKLSKGTTIQFQLTYVQYMYTIYSLWNDHLFPVRGTLEIIKMWEM